MQDPVVIFGAGNTGKTVIDIFNLNDVLVYGVLDDNKKIHNSEISEIVVLGQTDDNGFLKIIGNKTEAFVAIRNKEDRKRIVAMLNERRKTMPVNAIHPSSIIAADSAIGHGNLVSAGVIIAAGAVIGNHTFLHSRSTVGAGAKVADYCEIGIGVNIGPDVVVKEGAFIGDGVTIISGVTIGKNVRIGAGSVVIKSVDAETTVFGNPAQKV